MERTGRLVAARALSPSVQSLALELPAEFTFVAGQWLHVHVQTAQGLEKRAYSIASGPAERPVELAVTHVAEGAVSPLLCRLEVGTALRVDGPHGFFTRDDPHAPALFVGTGTGLSPLRSMLTELLADPAHPPVTLLFGVRTQADILWREQLERWTRDPKFRLEVTLSRPDASWHGRSGYVQKHVAELAGALGAPHVYICGLSPMVGDVRAICKTELGYDRKRIHSERYD
ncbi:MAG TPA: FAD-binding oxidoreductase [Polyangiales bacterium]|nr:FAD-binding oxidoreductase [Polyangiales bacterium]